MSRLSHQNNTSLACLIRKDLGNSSGYDHDSTRGRYMKHRRLPKDENSGEYKEYATANSHVDNNCHPIKSCPAELGHRGKTIRGMELSSPYLCGNSMKTEVMHKPQLNWEVEVDPWHSCKERASTPHHRFCEKDEPMEHNPKGGRIYIKDHIMSPESLEHDTSDLEVVKRLSPTREGQLLGANRIKYNLDRCWNQDVRERIAAKHYTRTGEFGYHIPRACSRKMFPHEDHMNNSEGFARHFSHEDQPVISESVFEHFSHGDSSHPNEVTGDASYVKKDALGDEDHVFKTSESDNDVGNVIRHTRHAAMSAAMSRSTRPW